MPRDAWKRLPPGPQRLFFEKLNELWESQGLPSGRAIAAALGKNRRTVMSQGTVNNMLNGPRISNWDNASALIRYLGREPRDFLPLWRDAKKAQHTATRPVESEEFPEQFSRVGDMTSAGVELELKSLMRSRSYFNHQTLLIRKPSTKSWTDDDRLTMDEVLELVDRAIGTLADETRRWTARVLFGITKDLRVKSLAERREVVAKELNRSPRTIQRLQPTLIEEVGEALTTILRNQG
ncbi:hypothetical protein AB0I60_08075 [Actinosynnema sp. NPDC050436]|uniref:hypothetical protein n=1 Tax=Actinosynnema sp. NPDC050436 TaxID=3155659 RepID=UPI0033C65C47